MLQSETFPTGTKALNQSSVTTVQTNGGKSLECGPEKDISTWEELLLSTQCDSKNSLASVTKHTSVQGIDNFLDGFNRSEVIPACLQLVLGGNC